MQLDTFADVDKFVDWVEMKQLPDLQRTEQSGGFPLKDLPMYGCIHVFVEDWKSAEAAKVVEAAEAAQAAQAAEVAQAAHAALANQVPN